MSIYDYLINLFVWKKKSNQLLKKYIIHIIDFNPLTLDMIKNIEKMNDNDKMKIILTYNKNIEYVYNSLKIKN